jgi:DNA-directed RNA polymerase subunit beta'
VLGCHYLTKSRGEILNPRAKDAKLAADDPRRLRVFHAPARCSRATTRASIGLHGRSRCATGMAPPRRSRARTSSPRRAACCSTTSCRGARLHQRDDGQEALENLVGDCYSRLGPEITSDLLDELKNLGFTYATQAGFTVSVDDVRIPPEKDEIIDGARKEVDQINVNYRERRDHRGERYNKVIDTWTHATTDVEQVTFDGLSQDRNGFNPIFMMADSGSRGNREQIRQLAGMRGLMAKPQKKITGGSGRSSSRRSCTTSRKASACSSTSSRRTARARVWPTPRSRPRTPATSRGASWTWRRT